MKFRVSISILAGLLTLGSGGHLSAQTVSTPMTVDELNGRLNDLKGDIRPVSTAVPFLTIAPDPRGSSMGETGVATTGDAASTFWNPARLAFVKNDYGFYTGYTPWLSKLVNDMWIGYLSGYYRLRKEDVIGVSLTYFNMGSIDFTDINGNPLGSSNPREFAITGSYSRILGKGFSAGLSAKFINSDLLGGFSYSVNGAQAKPGRTAAVDVGFLYNRDVYISTQKVNMAYGIAVSNVGGKISYSNSDRADFLPAMVRLGGAFTTDLDDFNKLTWTIEAAKIMAPSPQLEYLRTRDNSEDSLAEDGRRIPTGRYYTPNKSLLNGMFSSFGDAPFGFSEEMQEVMWSTGLEYWYNDLFAVRGGYFHESQNKGNRKYFSLGFGVKYSAIGLDFCYLIPQVRNHPLAETLRFALHFNFDKPKEKEADSITE